MKSLLVVSLILFSPMSSAIQCMDLLNTSSDFQKAQSWTSDQLLTHLLNDPYLIARENQSNHVRNPLALLDPQKPIPSFKLEKDEDGYFYGAIVDLKTGRQMMTFPIASRDFRYDFSEDGQLFTWREYGELRRSPYSDYFSSQTRVFDISTGEVLFNYPFNEEIEPFGQLRSLEFSDNFKKAIAHTDTAYLIMDMSTRSPKILATFRNTSEPVLSPDGQVVVVRKNRTQAVYKMTESGLTLLFEAPAASGRSFHVKYSAFNDVLFSANSRILVLKTGLSEVRVYDLSTPTPEVLSTLSFFRSYAKFLTPDGRFLIYGRGRNLYVYDLQKNALSATHRLAPGTKFHEVSVSQRTKILTTPEGQHMGLIVPVDIDVASTRVDRYLLGLGDERQSFLTLVKSGYR